MHIDAPTNEAKTNVKDTPTDNINEACYENSEEDTVTGLEADETIEAEEKNMTDMKDKDNNTAEKE